MHRKMEHEMKTLNGVVPSGLPAGEPEKHHGKTKTEATGAGKYFEYIFTGTGIEIYAQKHANLQALM